MPIDFQGLLSDPAVMLGAGLLSSGAGTYGGFGQGIGQGLLAGQKLAAEAQMRELERQKMKQNAAYQQALMQQMQYKVQQEKLAAERRQQSAAALQTAVAQLPPGPMKAAVAGIAAQDPEAAARMLFQVPGEQRAAAAAGRQAALFPGQLEAQRRAEIAFQNQQAMQPFEYLKAQTEAASGLREAQAYQQRQQTYEQYVGGLEQAKDPRAGQARLALDAGNFDALEKIAHPTAATDVNRQPFAVRTSEGEDIVAWNPRANTFTKMGSDEPYEMPKGATISRLPTIQAQTTLAELSKSEREQAGDIHDIDFQRDSIGSLRQYVRANPGVAGELSRWLTEKGLSISSAGQYLKEKGWGALGEFIKRGGKSIQMEGLREYLTQASLLRSELMPVITKEKGKFSKDDMDKVNAALGAIDTPADDESVEAALSTLDHWLWRVQQFKRKKALKMGIPEEILPKENEGGLLRSEAPADFGRRILEESRKSKEGLLR